MDNYICDTDFLFALSVPSDSNHERAVEISKNLINVNLYISNLVRQEFATVLSRRANYQTVHQVIFNSSWKGFNYFYISEDLEDEIWAEFKKYKKKNVSFIDCSNLVLARKLNAKLLSFDEFYPKNIRI